MVTPANHIEFIRLVSTGTNQMDAYKLTNGNSKVTEGAAKTGGSKLAKKYAKEIAEAHQINKDIVDVANKNAIVKAAEMTILSSAERQEILSLMVLDNKSNNTDKIKAIAELNKMDGSYAPSKVEAKVESHVVPDLNPEQIKALNDGIEGKY